MDSPTIYNCHIHTFTSSHLPKRFPPSWVKALMKIGFVREVLIYIATRFGLLLKLISVILPLESLSNSMLTIETLKRYERFFKTGLQKTQIDIFKKIRLQYPENTRFIVLPMDMEFMGAGKPILSYRHQLLELAHLHEANQDTVIPFFAADPRRPELIELFKEFVDHHGFKGVKLYPNLGYYPDHPKLKVLYALCQERRIPILSHCSSSGISQRGISAQKAQKFAHPSNYKSILNEFPELNFCLAHFGGTQEWERRLTGNLSQDAKDSSWLSVILDMLRSGEYPNLYTDVSYTLFSESPSYRPFSYFDYLKVMMVDNNIRTHVLFGSDYYMVEQEKISEKEVSIALRSRLGEEMYFQIANENPKNYLYESSQPFGESDDEKRISRAWHSAL